jgi:glycosyltransferase involved in cell wall biosynthesis
VADDGSSDGTLNYLDKLKIKGVEIIVLKNKRRGVHHQANTIIKKLNSMQFDVCFKVDDDVFFAKAGWDTKYFTEIVRTGFDHLVLYQPEWRKARHNRTYNGLVSMIDIDNVQGAFYTITKRVIKDVGYMDTKNFGLTGLGHVDFTARCCRAGFNRIETPLDIEGSKNHIKLQKVAYKSAIPMAWRNRENTSAVLRRKASLVKLSTRKFIAYAEIKLRVGQKK